LGCRVFGVGLEIRVRDYEFRFWTDTQM